MVNNTNYTTVQQYIDSQINEEITHNESVYAATQSGGDITDGREKCPVIDDHCKHFAYQLDRNGEVAITYCTHSENKDDREGNTTGSLCPLQKD